MLETPSTEFLEALIREEELEGYLSQVSLKSGLIYYSELRKSWKSSWFARTVQFFVVAECLDSASGSTSKLTVVNSMETN